MWASIKPLAILLSLGLNGAFVAAWVGSCAFRETPQPVSQGETDCCPLIKSIGVEGKEREDLQSRLENFREASAATCRNIQVLQQQLIELLEDPKVKREVLAAKQEEIVQEQRKLQELVVNHLLAEKGKLNEDQQKRLFKLLRTSCSSCDVKKQTKTDCDPDVGESCG